MKKLLLLLLLFSCILTSCAKDTTKNDTKPNIVCTVFPQYDFARQICGDKANISMLLPPGAEAHSYEPSPKDILLLKEADLFITIGGESEHWALSLSEDVNTLRLIDSVVGYEEEHTEGMEEIRHTHSEECNHEEHSYDEHIWTSPQNAISMCKSICDEVTKMDPDNKEYYTKNTDMYITKLQKLSNDFILARKNAKRDILIFGDRFPMRYLIEELSLKYYAAFPGCSSKSEPSAKTVAFLSDTATEENIPVIFYMDYSDGRVANAIANESGAKALRLYSCHNLSKEDFANGETYIGLMTKNLDALKEALNS